MSQHWILQSVCGVVAAGLLLLLPKIFPTVYINLAIEIYIFALFAVSFNLLFGYGGLLSFGHAAFFGVGAYTAGLIFSHLPNTPLLLTLSIASLSGLLAGTIIGFFCIRLKGAYFTLISLAFQMFLFTLSWKWRSVTNGDDGIGINRPELHLPALGSISMMDINNIYYFTMVVVALGIFACYLYLKTPLGNSVLCMRENDLRASFLGYNVFLTKLTVFSVSALLAALAGALFVFFGEFVGTSSIDINMSLTVAIMAVIGGIGNFLGPLIGAVFYMVFQDWISSLTRHWWLIMGISFILVIMYVEGGLINLFQLERIRVWVGRRGKVNE